MYSFVFLAGIVGLVSLIMSYDELSKAGLILCAIPVIACAAVFVKWNLSDGEISRLIAYYESPKGSKRLIFGVFVMGVLSVLTLYREGTVFWLWRRVHPKSAPTEHLGALRRGSGSHTNRAPISSALMGTSTSIFEDSDLDVRTIALIRLAFLVFPKRDRKTIIGIESFLRLGDGRKYRAYQQLVVEILDNKSTLKEIIHPYWRAINGNSATARIMFADLCRLAQETDNLNKRTINNIIRAGNELGLSQQDMQRAF